MELEQHFGITIQKLSTFTQVLLFAVFGKKFKLLGMKNKICFFIWQGICDSYFYCSIFIKLSRQI